MYGGYIFRIDLDLSYCLQSLPRLKTDTLQRSDGEDEEDGSLTLSPIGHNLLPNWEGLAIPFPVSFEQEGQDGVSVSLGDLVRHMHPYCMTISVENEEGEHILPEGGILLEVVDQGENGEPILAIPDMDLPVSLPSNEQTENEKVSDEAGSSDSSEHIVVDDEDVSCSKAPAKVKVAAPLKTASLVTKGEMVITRQKEGIREKSPSRRKKKKKTKTKCRTKPVDGKKPEQNLEGIKVAKLPPDSALPLPVELQKANPSPSVPHAKVAITTLEPEMNTQVQTSASPRLLETAPNTPPDTVASSQQPGERPGALAPGSSPPLDSLDTSTSPSQPVSPDVCDGPPPMAPSSEPKPKPLSLAEYRRLRQQKKPTPAEKMDVNNSSKWPSLPVLPKELPPIPCLPNPSTRDPRRTNPHIAKKEVEEVKPAWQPRGPCAPPTPEALLVPPAYMVSSASKVPAAKPQQTPEPLKSPSLQASPQPPSNSVENVAVEQHITPVLSGRQGSSSDPLKSEASPALSEGNGGFNQSPLDLKTRLKTTTHEVKSTAGPKFAPVASKTAASLPKGQDGSASTVTLGAVSSQSKPSEVHDAAAAVAAHASDSPALTAEPAPRENKDESCTGGKARKPKAPTQELIEAFTSEIGEF